MGRAQPRAHTSLRFRLCNAWPARSEVAAASDAAIQHGPDARVPAREGHRWAAERERSTQLFGFRTLRFLLQLPQLWYEPIRSIDELIDYLHLLGRLERAYAPGRPFIRLILQLFSSAHHSPTGDIAWPTPGEPRLALHSVIATGLSADGQSVKFANTWGESWGNRGNGTVSIDYLAQYFDQAWCMWNAKWGLAFYKPELATFSHDSDLRKVWKQVNPVFTTPLRGTRKGDRWIVERFYSYSPARDSSIEVIQMRNGYGLRMGWAHVCHVRETDQSEIIELFVMPAFRHQGVGSVLEGVACDDARSMSSTKMTAYLHDSDAGVLANRGSTRRFASARGYTIRWRPMRNPHLSATASKSL
ncbi:MAG: hypothetical protein JWO62_998 [Acidimicrobiaceae bacterium]|nr:hypothetical protein [Acidimicrobiaceae bacterium]